VDEAELPLEARAEVHQGPEAVAQQVRDQEDAGDDEGGLQHPDTVPVSTKAVPVPPIPTWPTAYGIDKSTE
jgi:hypothetical protein